MKKKSILICGHKSFAAEKLTELLESQGHSVDCFSRGIEGRNGCFISGDVAKINTNKYLNKNYDILINFIVIKNGTVSENIEYLRSLHEYCNRHVKNLLHISSISVYKNDEKRVTETSDIELDSSKKGSYARIKVESDKFLLNQKREYHLSFIRPGYIVSVDRKPGTEGIYYKLFRSFVLLLGNGKTSLPLIDRERMHLAIAKICISPTIEPCYLLLENSGGTKLYFLKKYCKVHHVSLPSWLILPSVYLLNKVKILNDTRYFQVKGLFKSTYFDSSITESYLKMSLTVHSIAVIGSGVYGSYAIKTICDKYPKVFITLFEAGDKRIKDEKEFGFKTKLINENYSGLSHGRFFGLGGTSAKWGGQLLFFTRNDFRNPNKFMRDLVDITEKYHLKILKKFNLNKVFGEYKISNVQFVKTGLWLGYFDRNLYKYFGISKLKNVRIEQNARIVKFINKGKKVIGAEIYQNEVFKLVYFDNFVLAAGAFESNRILLQSGLIHAEKVYFSDHLSRKIFVIDDLPQIGEFDMKFKRVGSALVTSRIIGEIDNYSYFAHPVYNSDFPFFQSLKRFLFREELNMTILKNIFYEMPYVFIFLYKLLIKNELFVYKNRWCLYLDIENPESKSFFKLGDKGKNNSFHNLDVYFDLDKKKITDIYRKAIDEVEKLLLLHNVKYNIVSDGFCYDKVEDTYHPYNMSLSDSEDMLSFYSRYESLLVVNTGILPRAGGINVTASLFPIIDEYVEHYLFR